MMKRIITKYNWPAWLLALGGLCAILFLSLTPITPEELAWIPIGIVCLGALSLIIGLGALAVWAIQALWEWIKAASSKYQKLLRTALSAALLIVAVPFVGFYIFAPLIALPAIVIQALLNQH